MVSDDWARFRDGVVGYFQPLTDPAVSPAPGAVRLTDKHCEITVLAEDEHLSAQLPIDAAAVYGDTEAGSVLLMALTHRQTAWNGIRTARYRSTCLALNPSPSVVDADLVSEVRLDYLGLSGWAGERVSDEPIVEDGQRVGWRAEVRWQRGAPVELDEGYTLRISSGYALEGTFDRRVLRSPLMFSVASKQRQSVGEHLVRLDALYALIAIAHRDVPIAASGWVKFDQAEAGYCELWDRTMVDHSDASHVTHSFGHFGLEHLGGPEGVAGWVRLVLEHRRAVEPVVRPSLFPHQTPEARLLSTAAAMEYWVKFNAVQHAWAAKQPGVPLPAALTRVVDPSWSDWIGDSGGWVGQFWNTYLDIKHYRGQPADARRVHALELAGRWLLCAALLDHCTQGRGPSGHLFTRGLSHLGRDLRKELWG